MLKHNYAKMNNGNLFNNISFAEKRKEIGRHVEVVIAGLLQRLTEDLNANKAFYWKNPRVSSKHSFNEQRERYKGDKRLPQAIF